MKEEKPVILTRESPAYKLQIEGAKVFILSLFGEQHKSKEWTVQEIVDSANHLAGLLTLRYALIALHHEGKIVLRRYAHNLFKYSLD